MKELYIYLFITIIYYLKIIYRGTPFWFFVLNRLFSGVKK